MKYDTPDWAQSLIAKSAGLNPEKVAVRHEDDRNIVFTQFMPHEDVSIRKKDGQVVRTTLARIE